MPLTDVLKSPFAYIAFQKLVGGTRMRSLCLSELAPKAGERILDLGCGPAYYLSELPRVDYHGFDTDEVYIEHARRRFGDRGHFYLETFTAEHAASLGPFDGVLLMGLLHHLDDPACRDLLGLVARSLKPDGRAIALDTAVHDAQNRFEHLLAVNDRGRFVRRPEAYAGLAEECFESVEGSLSHERLVPSVYWSMTLRLPRPDRGP